jgi:hypothetical protein
VTSPTLSIDPTALAEEVSASGGPNKETDASTTASEKETDISDEELSESEDEEEGPKRVLRMSHFEKALKEITPSASEQLGSLADLRKWNDEFGEGGRKRGKRIWGGKFGFTIKSGESEEGRVQQP